jgi:hypothetical protein
VASWRIGLLKCNFMHKYFPSQLEDEHVYLVVREHWILLFFRLLVWGIFVTVLLTFQVFGPEYIPGLFEGRLGEITSLFSQVYTLFLVLGLFLIWLFYYLNMQIITDRRIVDVDQVGLFSHTISELHIENIEDVTSQTNGILGNIFNFGTVFVQTAGNKERFEFDRVPNPSAINKLLLDLYEKVNKHNND